MFKSPGQAAYENYVSQTAGASVEGKALPSWEGLSEEKKEQWEAAALTLSDFSNDVKTKFRKNKGA